MRRCVRIARACTAARTYGLAAHTCGLEACRRLLIVEESVQRHAAAHRVGHEDHLKICGAGRRMCAAASHQTLKYQTQSQSSFPRVAARERVRKLPLVARPQEGDHSTAAALVRTVSGSVVRVDADPKSKVRGNIDNSLEALPEAVHVDKYASRRVQHLWHLLRRVSKWQRYARWHSRDGAHFERRFIDDDGGRRRSRLSGERLRRKVQKYPAMLWVHQLTAWSVSAEEAAVRTVQQRVRRPALERAYLSA